MTINRIAEDEEPEYPVEEPVEDPVEGPEISGRTEDLRRDRRISGRT